MRIRKLQQIVEGFKASLVEQGGPDLPWYYDATQLPGEFIIPETLGLPEGGSWEFVSPGDEGSGQGQFVYTDVLGYTWEMQTLDPPYNMEGWFPSDPDHPFHPANVVSDELADRFFPDWHDPENIQDMMSLNVNDLIDQGLAPSWLNDLPNGYYAVLQYHGEGNLPTILVAGPHGEVTLHWHSSASQGASIVMDEIYSQWINYQGPMSFIEFCDSALLNPILYDAYGPLGFALPGTGVDPDTYIVFPGDGTVLPPGAGPDGDGPDGPDGPDGDGDGDGPDNDPDGDGDGPDTDPDGSGGGGPDGDGPKYGDLDNSPGSSRFFKGADGRIRLLPKINPL